MNFYISILKRLSDLESKSKSQESEIHYLKKELFRLKSPAEYKVGDKLKNEICTNVEYCVLVFKEFTFCPYREYNFLYTYEFVDTKTGKKRFQSDYRYII